MNEEMVKSKIAGQLDASKQFLVVVIGLGMTNAVVEKLKYGLDGGIYILHYPSQPVDQDGKYTVFDGGSSISMSALVVLGIYLFYALRFFFNNYTLLHQTYSAERIKDFTGRKLLKTYRSSGRDLLLSIFTGIVLCLVSMTLTPARFEFLLIFLVMHYTVDLIALASNVWELDRTDADGKIYWKVFFWLLNNFVFIIVFAILITLMLTNNVPIDARILVLGAWFLNCIAALIITYLFREKVAESLLSAEPLEAAARGKLGTAMHPGE